MSKEVSSTDEKQPPSLDAITGFSKRRGFVFQASDIYGGLSGFWAVSYTHLTLPTTPYV